MCGRLTVQCVNSVQCTVHGILYTVNCTLYTVHCTLYTVHCTVPAGSPLCECGAPIGEDYWSVTGGRLEGEEVIAQLGDGCTGELSSESTTGSAVYCMLLYSQHLVL